MPNQSQPGTATPAPGGVPGAAPASGEGKTAYDRLIAKYGSPDKLADAFVGQQRQNQELGERLSRLESEFSRSAAAPQTIGDLTNEEFIAKHGPPPKQDEDPLGLARYMIDFQDEFQARRQAIASARDAEIEQFRGGNPELFEALKGGGHIEKVKQRHPEIMGLPNAAAHVYNYALMDLIIAKSGLGESQADAARGQQGRAAAAAAGGGGGSPAPGPEAAAEAAKAKRVAELTSTGAGSVFDAINRAGKSGP